MNDFLKPSSKLRENIWVFAGLNKLKPGGAINPPAATTDFLIKSLLTILN
jgi:hypothetical protein